MRGLIGKLVSRRSSRCSRRLDNTSRRRCGCRSNGAMSSWTTRVGVLGAKHSRIKCGSMLQVLNAQLRDQALPGMQARRLSTSSRPSLPFADKPLRSLPPRRRLHRPTTTHPRGARLDGLLFTWSICWHTWTSPARRWPRQGLRARSASGRPGARTLRPLGMSLGSSRKASWTSPEADRSAAGSRFPCWETCGRPAQGTWEGCPPMCRCPFWSCPCRARRALSWVARGLPSRAP
mmetsp:Transcript_127212/g.407093  ORF Transcript_127212/g.407093 Transcript_127212/m.407093 type:complete len:234 (+) Transcript_127212:458-1159(+)